MTISGQKVYQAGFKFSHLEGGQFMKYEVEKLLFGNMKLLIINREIRLS